MTATSELPEFLAGMDGWTLIDGLGWLREVDGDFWWWHPCGLGVIDVSSGERHAITGGSLDGGDLTIGGGSGSIPCSGCGLHGWVRNGRWVTA